MLFVKAKTLVDLGWLSLWRVARYRLGIRLGFNPVRRLVAQPLHGCFFRSVQPRADLPVPVDAWQGEAKWYGFHPVTFGDGPPDWHANPLTGVRVKDPLRPWWTIPDFNPELGDIKAVWEASRFDWVLAFAQRAATGDGTALSQLNEWLNHWCQHNPPYLGVNWKCGQEASIRVMHLAMAALLMQQATSAAPLLLDLIAQHLQRIVPTVSYAMAQDNNHGTSEAAALYIGGSWLVANGRQEGRPWQDAGRYWLEDRAKRLIGRQGSFSQHSLTYHRVMLDTYCMVQLWRNVVAAPGLSAACLAQLAAATNWLGSMLDPVSGDGPNLGANDGARLLQLTQTAYRDFRPSLHLASALFLNKSAVKQAGPWDDVLRWFGLPRPASVAQFDKNVSLDDGGYSVMSAGPAWLMLRYPRFRFRPSHADALHIDLWLNGINVLRDAGTYSYNTDPEWQKYFPGTASHNTVQFDGQDQMPKLSRFLFGDWLRTHSLETVGIKSGHAQARAGYSNRYGHRHVRTIDLQAACLQVADEISGFERQAVLRWHLCPGDWVLTDRGVRNGTLRIEMSSSEPWQSLTLGMSSHSRFYMHKTEAPVLELTFNKAAVIKTIVYWDV